MVIGGEADLSDTFGQVYDLKLMQSNNSWWSTSYRGLTFGNTDIHNSVMNVAILDTGTSLIALPDNDYNAFVLKLLTSVKEFDCTTYAQCAIAD